MRDVQDTIFEIDIFFPYFIRVCTVALSSFLVCKFPDEKSVVCLVRDLLKTSRHFVCLNFGIFSICFNCGKFGYRPKDLKTYYGYGY